MKFFRLISRLIMAVQFRESFELVSISLPGGRPAYCPNTDELRCSTPFTLSVMSITAEYPARCCKVLCGN